MHVRLEGAWKGFDNEVERGKSAGKAGAPEFSHMQVTAHAGDRELRGLDMAPKPMRALIPLLQPVGHTAAACQVRRPTGFVESQKPTRAEFVNMDPAVDQARDWILVCNP